MILIHLGEYQSHPVAKNLLELRSDRSKLFFYSSNIMLVTKFKKTLNDMKISKANIDSIFIHPERISSTQLPQECYPFFQSIFLSLVVTQQPLVILHADELPLSRFPSIDNVQLTLRLSIDYFFTKKNIAIAMDDVSTMRRPPLKEIHPTGESSTAIARKLFAQWKKVMPRLCKMANAKQAKQTRIINTLKLKRLGNNGSESSLVSSSTLLYNGSPGHPHEQKTMPCTLPSVN